MPGPGGGPSRRSHTKSRKGCKTCKRRHIRCDETFPQCRNCTKHQVRCDYMDSPTAGDESLRLPHQANLLWTPEIEKTVNSWRASGQFPFPDLQIFPQPQWQTLSKTDLRLIYHLSTITNELQSSRTSKLTIWTELMPKFLSTASFAPFVMHAILAFSASHLAWISQSSETRNIAIHHGGIALKGLHEAIAGFSKANSDAVLAASLLLTWQATDWRGWSSLMHSTKTVINAMQAWREDSVFSEYLSQQSTLALQPLSNESSFQVTPDTRREHLVALQRIQEALQRLQPYLVAYEHEGKWVEQLNGYIHRLKTSNPAQTPEEQFNQLYALRKWLFWVPVTLLSARKGDVWTLLVLAHYYGAGLTLEPLFPDIGSPFLGTLALHPLEEIVRIINTIQSSPNLNYQAAVMMMDFPRDAISSFQSRVEWKSQQQQDSIPSVQQPPQYNLESLNVDLGNHFNEFGYNQSLSPAFVPSPMQQSPPSMLPGAAPQPRSPYLEVPRSGVETFNYSSAMTSAYSTPLTSPASATQAQAPPLFSRAEEPTSNIFNYNMPFGYHSAAVGVQQQPSVAEDPNPSDKGKERQDSGPPRLQQHPSQ